MKVLILAGGFGTRLSEETINVPKPMVLLDDKPILWHIMNSFASQGFSHFLIAAGYKAEKIFEWSQNLKNDWNVEVIDTGLDTQTGGRIKRCMSLNSSPEFFLTYGDGLANVNLNKLLEFHRNSRKMATVTAVRPVARFGVLEIKSGLVTDFGEKRQTDTGWINGGFFILKKSISNYILSDGDSFEFHTLPNIVADGELAAFKHLGFWQPMDTLRERNLLSNLLRKPGPPPWLRI
jgi:glucose-1-phosphate cytidylyltransferase